MGTGVLSEVADHRQLSQRVLESANCYPFDNRIITMHIYDGNQQNVTSW
jgi:hypothetical protein